MRISQLDQSSAADLSDLRVPELKSIGLRLLEKLPVESVDLIPLQARHSAAEIRKLFPLEPLVVCDFYISQAEKQSFVDFGFDFQASQILNIDHHADYAPMKRQISSGNLAISYVNKHGVVPAGSRVIINHTDCDSVISSLIVRGLLPCHNIFAEAVVAADHTGVENQIADLLQALDIRRDYNFSVKNLALLLAGEPLERSAQKLLDNRIEGRLETCRAVNSGQAIRSRGDLTVVYMSENMRNQFLPALFPESSVILTFEKGSKGPEHRIARLRLGNAAPDGFTLFSLPMAELDPNFGGRWNAGSNKRGGGLFGDPQDYVSRFEVAVKQTLERFK